MTVETLSASQKLNAVLNRLEPAQPQQQTTELQQLANDFVQTLKSQEISAKTNLVQEGDVQDLVVSLAKTRLAIETVVSVRDKMVQSVNDVMRMQM